MTDSQAFWAMVYLVKLFRGDRTSECRDVADKAREDFENMLDGED